MQFIHRLIARFRGWRLLDRHTGPKASDALLVALPVMIHREVSSNGVRVYSLCASCGARLGASATLCEDCAKESHKS